MFEVEAVAVELRDAARGDDDAGRVPVLEHVQREQQRLAHRRREPVVGRRRQRQDVDLRRRLRADEMSACAGDAEAEEGCRGGWWWW